MSLGEIVIILDGLNQPVRSGKSIPVTFVFRNSGAVTIEVPIAVPTTPRHASTGQPGGHG